MTVGILVPITSTAGLDRLVTENNGFPDDGLASLFLFGDGAGAAPANSVAGGPAAAITSQVASNNANSWLTGGGGLHIEGGAGVSLPAIDLRNPWSIVTGGMVTGSVADGTTRNYQLLSFLASATTNFRGAFLALEGGTTWNPPVVNLSYDCRVSNGAGGSTGASVFGSSNSAINTGRVKMLSYNGVDTITAAIYDKTGAVLFSGTVATTDANLVTGLAGAVQNSVQPFIGPYPSATWCGGKQNVEAAAVYTRALAAADITAIAAACSALGTARGRAW